MGTVLVFALFPQALDSDHFRSEELIAPLRTTKATSSCETCKKIGHFASNLKGFADALKLQFRKLPLLVPELGDTMATVGLMSRTRCPCPVTMLGYIAEGTLQL